MIHRPIRIIYNQKKTFSTLTKILHSSPKILHKNQSNIPN